MYGFYWEWWFPWYEYERGIGQNCLNDNYLEALIDAWMNED